MIFLSEEESGCEFADVYLSDAYVSIDRSLSTSSYSDSDVAVARKRSKVDLIKMNTNCRR